MDDIILGGDKETVDRMRGVKLASGQYSGTVTRILATCGMVPKFMAVSGDRDLAAAEPLGSKVLGLKYSLGEDAVIFKIEFNIFIKIKGSKESCRLSSDDLRAIQKDHTQPVARLV